MNQIELKRLAAYEDDFALWSAEQAALLRAGKFDRLDIENIAEEIESLGRSDKKEIRYRLEVLLTHLLKWDKQPEHRSRSWAATIRDQRRAILDLLDDSPSLRPYPATLVDSRYAGARERAALETAIAPDLFPAACPYSIEQILDPAFLPGTL